MDTTEHAGRVVNLEVANMILVFIAVVITGTVLGHGVARLIGVA